MHDYEKAIIAMRHLNDGKRLLEKELAYAEKTCPACTNDEVKEGIEGYEFAFKVIHELSKKLAVEYSAEFWENRKEVWKGKVAPP